MKPVTDTHARLVEKAIEFDLDHGLIALRLPDAVTIARTLERSRWPEVAEAATKWRREMARRTRTKYIRRGLIAPMLAAMWRYDCPLTSTVMDVSYTFRCASPRDVRAMIRASTIPLDLQHEGLADARKVKAPSVESIMGPALAKRSSWLIAEEAHAITTAAGNVSTVHQVRIVLAKMAKAGKIDRCFVARDGTRRLAYGRRGLEKPVHAITKDDIDWDRARRAVEHLAVRNIKTSIEAMDRHLSKRSIRQEIRAPVIASMIDAGELVQIDGYYMLPRRSHA